ncbi:MAG: biopolymer transporter ExbD [Candidatus Omnitrophica bacterium]|nr:biopolymer transporter ExbD [Candidatus Omnitrophota bacterium]
MKFKRRLKIEKGMIDLTPMVNIFFLLFIFFLFTSSFIFQPGIKVSLPKAVTSEVMQLDNVTVTVTRDDKIYLEDKQVTPEELGSRLKVLAKEKMGLLIKADSRAPLGRIVEIWDACRREGVSQINIATNQ